MTNSTDSDASDDENQNDSNGEDDQSDDVSDQTDAPEETGKTLVNNFKQSLGAATTCFHFIFSISFTSQFQLINVPLTKGHHCGIIFM